MEKELEIEKKHLEKVINQYEDILEIEKIRLNAIHSSYKFNERLMDKMLQQTENKIHVMENVKEKPYFAKIDFKEENADEIHNYYIGKVGVFGEDNNLITIDWRSPIASMYYDSNLGLTSYISPEGEVRGELFIKRQFEIDDGKLLSFQDVDAISNDEILKPYLGVTADNRLKNIVSSIQKEQNEIIRKDIDDNLVVSGVAGSGKTTVALHRIAYLVYNNRDLIDSEQYMVIGPNKFLLNYISSVLPDLDVNNVSQLTFEEFTKNVLNEKFIVDSDDEKINNIIKEKYERKFNRLKTSLLYKKALNKYIKDFVRNLLPNEDFCIKGYKIISLDTIRKIYSDINETRYYNIESIIDKMKIRIKKYINDNYNIIISKIENEMHINFQNCSNHNEEEQIIKDFAFVKKELSRNNMPSLKKYFSKASSKILSLYTDFVNNLDKYLEMDTSMKKEQEVTIKKLKKRVVDFEDLSALLYLKYKMCENKNYKKLKYVVIDEAQDFGEFNFYILKKIMPNSKFSIFGDLAQSIYGYRSINNWKKVLNVFKGSEMMYLLKSYRTTIEIMNEANKILSFIGLKVANPVIRHGNNVLYIKEENLITQIKDKIKEYQDRGYKSIAVISKTIEENNRLNYLLGDVYNVSSNDVEYIGGVCTIVSYLAKGLEFDAVIINDASSSNYNEKNEMDMKLLYVIMTRALHELCVFYKNDLINILK